MTLKFLFLAWNNFASIFWGFILLCGHNSVKNIQSIAEIFTYIMVVTKNYLKPYLNNHFHKYHFR